MEIRDGFIIGIHNYCDGQCDRCAFTSYCRVFVHAAETDAFFDPNLTAIVEAPLLEAHEPSMRSGMHEMCADEASTTMPGHEWAQCQPRIPPEHEPIDARAFSYATRLHDWLNVRNGVGPWNTDERCSVIARSGVFIAMKARRAVSVWANDGEDQAWSSDQEGSAKVALIAMERSHAAWRDLVEHGVTSPDGAQPFIADLVWIHEALEQARPNARRFVRPAFDEPDEVAKLRAE